MMKILNIRIDQEVKDEIDSLANEEGISSSEFARNILYKYLYYHKESNTFWDPKRIGEPVILYVDADIKKESPQIINRGYRDEK